MRGGARQMLVMTNEMENFIKFKTHEGGERGRERLKYEYFIWAHPMGGHSRMMGLVWLTWPNYDMKR